MSASKKWVGVGLMGLAACLWFAEATPVFAVMSHDAHVAVDAAVDVATPVHTQAGPILMDKMSKAIEQIERQVQSKGPFQGAGAHAMQQGILLVAEDQDKVKVTQGARCPAQAPVRAFDISTINVEISVNRFGDFYPGYMYALTENVAGVRAEEAKNLAARESDDPTFAAGAVSHGLQMPPTHCPE